MSEIAREKAKPHYLGAILQSTGSGMLWLMILLVLGGLYLSVSAKTAQLGRDVIQAQEEVKQKEIIRNEREADLAMRISPFITRARLESEGFIDATLDTTEFTSAVGVNGEVEFTAPVPDSYFTDYDHMLSPAYTETLIDGFRRWFELEDSE
jgi:hypothetical protein